MKIPFLSFEPIHKLIKDDIIDAFEKFYDSYWYILGNNLEQFEHQYAKFNEVRYAVGVSNGLDALFLSLKALGIKENDEVIVPSNTYIATALAVSYLGAKPIFVEPNIDTYNIDVKLIRKAITKNTKAIMPVHLYGQACEMDQIMDLASEYDLKVVEDNAQAHGAKFKNKLTGSWGHINGTSFYPGKNLGAFGDGGAVTTNNELLAEKVKLLRNYGSGEKYKNEIIGYNMRLDEIQATFLSIKLKHLQNWTFERQKIASFYNEMLKDIGDITTPFVNLNSTHSYHLYVIRTAKRDKLFKFLIDKGVGVMIHYPFPPHLQNAFKNLGYGKGDFPISETLASTSLSLPIYPGLKIESIEYIVKTIHDFFKIN
jgi:dTDP-4-amino-4,6-dideoxygalactose transaminase